MFSTLRQTVAVTLFNLRNLPERIGGSAVTVFGIAGVVMVFVGILSIASGFRQTITSSGDPQNALVLRAGADTEMVSGIFLDSTKIIAEAPGVARDADGPISSAELYVIVDVPIKATGTAANVPLRGVLPAAFKVRHGVEVVAGRRFEPGRNEVIVGKRAAAEFAGIDLGDKVRWGETEWSVVGIFESGGTVAESEIWTDALVLQPAYRRGNSFQSVRLRMTSPDAFQALSDSLTNDPRLSVKVLKETEFYAEQGTRLTGLIMTLGLAIGLLMGIGAVFGALNTMYSAVSARTREIATLRALGFGATPVVVSVLLEGAILALAGGVVGATLAYFLFNGAQAATLNWQTFSQVAFAFAVTPPLLVGGVVYALFMGFVGGLFPAIRAARLPVSTALRQV